MTKMLQKSDLILMLRKQVTLQWCDRNGVGTSVPLKVEVEAPTYYLATFSPSYARKIYWTIRCASLAPHIGSDNAKRRSDVMTQIATQSARFSETFSVVSMEFPGYCC